jgi:hypothetical protein
MCFDLGQLDAAGAAGPAGEIGEGWPSDLEHGVCFPSRGGSTWEDAPCGYLRWCFAVQRKS